MGIINKIISTGNVTETADELKQTTKKLKFSLNFRHLDSGSCNGCDFELNQLTNSVYDIQQYGIDIVASPRHADGLLVTGSVTHNLLEAVKKTYEAVPEPKYVIAVGDCACGRGKLPNSYAAHQAVKEVLPVDVEIFGCPPAPEEIIKTIINKLGVEKKDK